MGKRYFLQNRHQDSGWEDLSGDGYEFDELEPAIRRAAECSRDAIIYGMVRVVDGVQVQVIQTFAAGGERMTAVRRVRKCGAFSRHGQLCDRDCPPDQCLFRAGYDRQGNKIGCGQCDNCMSGCQCLHHGPWHGRSVVLSRAEYDRLMQRVADLEARLADESLLARALAEMDKPEPIDGEWW